MKYEVLKRSHLKRNILIGIIVVFILSTVILTFTRAKYRTTQSIPLIQGTINFSPSDLNIVAMYLNQDGAIPAGQTDIAPKFGYTLNEEQSFCEVNDEKIRDASILYEDGYLYFNKLNRKGTKCSVYFDLIPDSEKPTLSISVPSTDNSITVVANASDNIGIYYYYFQLDNEEEIRSEENSYTFDGLEKDSTHTITVRVVDAAGNEVNTSKEVTVGYRTADYILASANPPTGQTTDWTGATTYYYTGNSNNWVRFAGFYWRIIRINGDESIRMIYQGIADSETPDNGNITGTGTQIGTSAFNSSYNNNMYVGYMYQSGQLHGLQTSSTIKGILDNWYTNNIENEEKNLHYGEYIDGNAGFCGDRRVSSGNGTSTSTTYYQANTRITQNNSPNLTCQTEDIYTTSDSDTGNKSLSQSIGLISVDEAALAGITWNNVNTENYLYTKQIYWTLSPTYFAYGYARVFFVNLNGSFNYSGISSGWNVSSTFGVRPVINLRSDVQITGTGSQTDPFVVVGAS